MNSNVLKFVGIFIAAVDLIVAIILPGAYRDAMERKYKDDITATQATVVSVSSTSEYHRGGKGSRGTTHYIYKILAKADTEVMSLIEHDTTDKNVQIERNDIITVYCLNDKYAYAKEDFYKLGDLGKALMFTPLIIGVGMVMVGSLLGKKSY